MIRKLLCWLGFHSYINIKTDGPDELWYDECRHCQKIGGIYEEATVLVRK